MKKVFNNIDIFMPLWQIIVINQKEKSKKSIYTRRRFSIWLYFGRFLLYRGCSYVLFTVF